MESERLLPRDVLFFPFCCRLGIQDATLPLCLNVCRTQRYSDAILRDVRDEVVAWTYVTGETGATVFPETTLSTRF